jgi:hypothetical protein
MNLNKTIIAIGLLTVFIACQKKEVEPEPEEPEPFVQQPADVLNTNSGYASVYDYVKNVEGVSGLLGHLAVNDFMIENNNLLHYVYNWGLQSQQSYLTTNKRETINLTNKESISQPSYTSYFNSNLVNIYTGPANIIYKSFSNYANIVTNSYQCNGDVPSSSIGTTLNFGNLEIDLFYPQFNLGKVDNSQATLQQTYISRGLQSPPNASLYGCTAQTYTFTNPSASQVILGGMFDWQRTTATVNTHGFLLRNDSMIVYNCNTQTMQKITGVSVLGLTTSNNVTTFRKYSLDGNTIGLVFKDINTNTFWSYSYNFTTQIIIKGVENITLDYSGAGSDIDADEYGNIYYSGVAGNGSITNGVSIYKKDITGSTTLVGADNFLKFGTISKLKYLYGKVYLVVTGTISGTSYKQITFLKQN